jgi:hypothetical protein
MPVIDDIYNAFNPMPLPAGAPQYVDFRSVRGGNDVSIELGRKVCRSSEPTCQLFSGHLGGGKSTELLKLAAELKGKGFTVVYFSADDDDINTEDVEYADILLACTRHLLEVVKEADPEPVVSWLKDRWAILSDVMQTRLEVPEASIEASVQFAKITSKIRTQKTQRAELRTKLNPYTEDLVVALNQFIEQAKSRLPKDRNKLIVIADGLEKIQYISQGDDGRSNHDDIFITKAPQLKSLACHVIYTVPVSLALSTRASDLMDIYGCSPDVLPMIGVKSRDGVERSDGMAKMREMLAARISEVAEAKGMKLEGEVFEDGATLDLLCRMTGGHVRNLVILMQYAIDYQDQLPLTQNSVELALRKMRRTYRESVNAAANEWELLAQVAIAKIAPNDDRFRSLLFRRCVLQYLDEAGKVWHDVHPLLEGTEEFQAALRGVTT